MVLCCLPNRARVGNVPLCRSAPGACACAPPAAPRPPSPSSLISSPFLAPIPSSPRPSAPRLSVVRTYCGHGIGDLFHCAPNVPHYAKNKAKGTMKVGEVFTIGAAAGRRLASGASGV